MLAGRRQRVDVPHEQGAWVEFRTLSGAELDDAEESQTRRAMRLVAEMSGDAMRTWSEQARAQTADQPQAAGSKYDKDVLIRYGVADWSLAEPCNDVNKRALDSVTRDWAVGVILEMNTRPNLTAPDSNGYSEAATSLPKSITSID